MAMAWDLWTAFRLRAMSSAGVQLAIWQPAPEVYPIRLELDYPREVEERSTAGGGQYPSLRGRRGTVELEIQTAAGHFAGAGITQPLEDVLDAEEQNAGAYLELALHLIAGVYDYKRVNLQPPGYVPEALRGKDIGLRARMTFTAAVPQQAGPPRDSTTRAW